MSKSKLEIINETAKYYTSKNRGIDYPNCMYITDDGKRCAVGRCLREDLDVKNFMGDVVDLVHNYKASTIDDLLQDEYKGHHMSFWSDLQEFHDRSSNWDDNGLTRDGHLHLEQLKEKWT